MKDMKAGEARRFSRKCGDSQLERTIDNIKDRCMINRFSYYTTESLSDETIGRLRKLGYQVKDLGSLSIEQDGLISKK